MVKSRAVVVVLIILCAVCCAPGISYAREGDTVGYATVAVPLGNTEKIPCAVWYPALRGNAHVAYELGRNTRTGAAFIDAAPDTGGGPYPLVVYSHGYSGCSAASAYLCEALAAAGFVVAAPDHSDDLKICSLRPGFRPEPFVGFRILFSAIQLGNELAAGDYDVEKFRYRFIEIKAAIDYLLAEGRNDRSPYFGLIDAGHIGAVGHSLGGFSVMVAAGAKDVGIDFPIDAVVSMSGPGGDAFSCNDMKRIAIPAMLMYGTEEADRQKKAAGIHAQYRCLAGPKFLMGISGGDHLTFSERMLRDSSREGESRRKADARHDLISRYVTAFFTLYLAGDEKSRALLRENDPGLSPYYFSF